MYRACKRVQFAPSVAAASPTLPTIGDVARRAKVSTATVSRVVNAPDSVRDELRTRVEAAIVQLGYVPHAGARTLKSRRTGTIGAIFPTVDNAIFATAINALQRRLAEADHQLLIATHDYSPATEESQALNLLTRGADALVLCGTGQRPALLAAAEVARRTGRARDELAAARRPGLRRLRQCAGDGAGGALPARPRPPPHRDAGRRHARQRPCRRTPGRRARRAGRRRADAAGLARGRAALRPRTPRARACSD